MMPGLEEESGAGGTAFDTEIVDDFVLLSPPRGATVIEEEIVKENMYLTTKKNCFVELFPGNAGEGNRKSKIRFEEWLEIQEAEGRNMWVLRFHSSIFAISFIFVIICLVIFFSYLFYFCYHFYLGTWTIFVISCR